MPAADLAEPVSRATLNRCTLHRQLLDRRVPLGAAEAVRRVVAVQAQEPASPYVALWNRVHAFDPADLDVAFATHEVVKATLLRMTLHAVHRDDYPAFHTAMATALRSARLGDPRFAGSGIGPEAVDALVPRLLEFARRPRTNTELAATVDGWLGAGTDPGPWWAIRLFAPLVHAPTQGPWTFGTRPSYLASPHAPSPDEHAACVARLVRRYLEGFGPATLADVAGFLRLRRGVVRAALAGLPTRPGPDGAVLHDLPGARLTDPDTDVPPRLMAMWDSVLFAYADRSRVVAPEYRRLIVRTNGDTLPTLFVDGHVAGAWRATPEGIEVGTFHTLPARTWRDIEPEACHLHAFLADRDPSVYRRYAHWWSTLPLVRTRIFG